MAIDLTVSLTDSEQAVVEAVAAKVAPGATALQIKAWAEQQSKAGLRAAVLARRAAFDEQEVIDARIAREVEALTGFPEPATPNGG